jgi:hypothetical protein
MDCHRTHGRLNTRNTELQFELGLFEETGRAE